MKAILPAVLILYFFGSCSTTVKKTDLEIHELKGPVKSVRHDAYSAEEVSGKVVKGQRNGMVPTYRLFNRKGMLLRDDCINKHRSLKQWETQGIHALYNAEGVRIKDSIWSVYPKKLEGFYHYRYSRSGNLIEKRFCNTKGKTVTRERFHYDPKGQIVACYFYFTKKLDFCVFYRYDKHGNKIRNTYFEKGLKGKYVTLMKYDKYNNAISYFSYGPQKRITSWDRIRYNEQGDPIRIHHLQPNGKSDYVEKMQYAYDSHGNWIRKTTMIWDDASSIEEQQFTYY